MSFCFSSNPCQLVCEANGGKRDTDAAEEGVGDVPIAIHPFGAPYGQAAILLASKWLRTGKSVESNRGSAEEVIETLVE